MKHSVQASTQWSIACAVGYLLALGVLVSSVDVGHAVPMPYTNKAVFTADMLALLIPNGTLDFDSQVPGNLTAAPLPVPGAGVGIKFPTSVPDVLGGPPLPLAIVANTMPANGNPTTTEPNSLGTDDPGNFDTIIAGTELTFMFTGPVRAFGLSIITPDVLLDDDILLNFGGVTAMLDADAPIASIGPFGRTTFFVYFLGVIVDAEFSSATLTYGLPNDGAFLFNADDFIVAAPVPTTQIPEPGTLVLLGMGMVGLMCWRCWRAGSTLDR